MYSKDWLALYQEDPESIRQLAQDPNTEPRILSELVAALIDLGFGREVASNPNTPPSTLRALARYYPKEFFQNPILPMLLLEGPAFFAECVCEESCAEPSSPASFLRVAFGAQRPELRELIALHPNTSPDMLIQLSTHPSPRVRRAVALHSTTPQEARDRLKLDPNSEVADAAKSYPEVLQSSGINLTHFARYTFSPQGILEEHRKFLACEYDYFRDYDCKCFHCGVMRLADEMLEQDNSQHPLDIGTQRAHRPREPKTDPSKRKNNLGSLFSRR